MICTSLYVAVSLVVVGMQNYTELDTAAPLAAAFQAVERPIFANLITLGALAGLTTVMMILMLGQSRVAFAMSRDGLLPRWLSTVHPRFGTPHRLTIIIGVVVAALAGFIPLEELAELVNIGTLFAFVLVSVAVIVLRRTRPELPRAFRTRLVPFLPVLAVLSCIALMLFLTVNTWLSVPGLDGDRVHRLLPLQQEAQPPRPGRQRTHPDPRQRRPHECLRDTTARMTIDRERGVIVSRVGEPAEEQQPDHGERGAGRRACAPSDPAAHPVTAAAPAP